MTPSRVPKDKRQIAEDKHAEIWIISALYSGALTFIFDEVHPVCQLVEYHKLWLPVSSLWMFYRAVCVLRNRGQKVQIAQI